jgi:hypothetical protein
VTLSYIFGAADARIADAYRRIFSNCMTCIGQLICGSMVRFGFAHFKAVRVIRCGAQIKISVG